jgi:DNA-binding XRE family transcriptional regulator
MKALMPGIGQGRGGGRKPGTTLTETSTFFARLRATMGVSKETLAREIGVTVRTAFNYEDKGIIPKAGTARQKLERLGKLHGVPIEEPQA